MKVPGYKLVVTLLIAMTDLSLAVSYSSCMSWQKVITMVNLKRRNFKYEYIEYSNIQFDFVSHLVIH